MKNTQLTKLLARTPLSEEDVYNVSVIFSALSEERQLHILNHWEECIARLIIERRKLDQEQAVELIAPLKQANTILDEAIARKKQQEKERQQKKEQIREELESEIIYENMKKSRAIRDICCSQENA